VTSSCHELPGIVRTSAFAAHSRGGDISAIGRRLGVTHAIEGSVRRSDDRIRVTAQLIEVDRQCHVWSERFDRALADLFVIHDEIADAIARRLELTLGTRRQRADERHGSVPVLARRTSSFPQRHT
jgi:TolB-like protein